MCDTKDQNKISGKNIFYFKKSTTMCVTIITIINSNSITWILNKLYPGNKGDTYYSSYHNMIKRIWEETDCHLMINYENNINCTEEILHRQKKIFNSTVINTTTIK